LKTTTLNNNNKEIYIMVQRRKNLDFLRIQQTTLIVQGEVMVRLQKTNLSAVWWVILQAPLVKVPLGFMKKWFRSLKEMCANTFGLNNN